MVTFQVQDFDLFSKFKSQGALFIKQLGYMAEVCDLRKLFLLFYLTLRKNSTSLTGLSLNPNPVVFGHDTCITESYQKGGGLI